MGTGKMTCPICGNSDFSKENSMLVCKSCGTSYTLAEAKELSAQAASGGGKSNQEELKELLELKKKLEVVKSIEKEINQLESDIRNYELSSNNTVNPYSTGNSTAKTSELQNSKNAKAEKTVKSFKTPVKIIGIFVIVAAFVLIFIKAGGDANNMQLGLLFPLAFGAAFLAFLPSNDGSRTSRAVFVPYMIFFIISVMLTAYIGYNLFMPRIREATGQEQLENGDYIGAYRTYMKIKDEKNRSEKINELFNGHFNDLLPLLEVDDVFVFGSFEQDNDLTNGSEPLEWVIVSKENGKISAITKKGVDYFEYNKNGYGINSYAESSIRVWLNEEFLQNAFSREETDKLVKDALLGDKVTLMSEYTFTNSFSSSKYTRVEATDYAMRTWSGMDKNGKFCSWYLINMQDKEAYYVLVNGYKIESSIFLSNKRAIRPYIVIDLGGN